MKPTVVIPDDIAAVLKFHCTSSGVAVGSYIKTLVYNDLIAKYPDLIRRTKKETATP